jgi:hypothetical protein
MFFLFDFGNYFKMIRLAWNEKVPRARYYYLAVLLVGVPITSSFHAICFLLDWILFPDLKKVEVREPIFMVGHARSGTTLTHRLMSKDSGRFSSFMLYELYFPSLIQKKVIRALARFDDEKMSGLLAGQVRAWEEWRYGKMPRTGQICLIRSVVVSTLLTGGAEKGPSFSYSPDSRHGHPSVRYRWPHPDYVRSASQRSRLRRNRSVGRSATDDEISAGSSASPGQQW